MNENFWNYFKITFLTKPKIGFQHFPRFCMLFPRRSARLANLARRQTPHAFQPPTAMLQAFFLIFQT